MQLQRNLAEFGDAGVAVFAISYDPVEAQRAFADQFGITFPLLADPDHAAIEAVGILNTLIEPDNGLYGIPHPGSYVVGTDGTIEEKLFFQNFRNRPSAASVLRDGLGIDFGVSTHPAADASGSGVRVRATLGGETMVFGEVSTLYVDFEVDEGLHLYAEPIPEGYIPTTVSIEVPNRVRVEATQLPPSRPFRVEGLDEQFHVYTGEPIRFATPISNGLTEGDSFPLTVHVRYQACTDRECLLPQELTLELEVPIAALEVP